MGLFYSICKNCDEELHWFFEVKNGIICKNCGVHNTEDEVKDSLVNWKSEYRTNKELFLKKRKVIREQIKKSL